MMMMMIMMINNNTTTTTTTTNNDDDTSNKTYIDYLDSEISTQFSNTYTKTEVDALLSITNLTGSDNLDISNNQISLTYPSIRKEASMDQQWAGAGAGLDAAACKQICLYDNTNRKYYTCMYVYIYIYIHIYA